KIPWWRFIDRGHFYFGQRGQPDFGFRGQINLAAGVIRAWVFQAVLMLCWVWNIEIDSTSIFCTRLRSWRIMATMLPIITIKRKYPMNILCCKSIFIDFAFL
ncbi:hypothetical protein, partial [Bacteroides acidifaciens]|uniref:hypothetical protein n=1 Tax=Bacteroides acidifaciens TaxID=85831 RepID=UPI0025843B0A